MAQSKIDLRKNYLDQLKKLSVDKRTKINNQLQSLLFKHPKWSKATVIGVTISMQHEWDTWPIIEQAWSEGKTVVVPKCHHANKTMSFHQVNSRDDLAIQYFDLLEPIESRTKQFSKNQIDLLLVPGIVFDQAHYRIGHGGGYYDRFLTDFNSATLSLAWEKQVIDRFKTQIFDQPVDELLIARIEQSPEH